MPISIFTSAKSPEILSRTTSLNNSISQENDLLTKSAAPVFNPHLCDLDEDDPQEIGKQMT